MLKTLDEALLEAQGGDIDLAMGHSILKDIYKRQNFTIKSAKYTGKQKVQFVFTDPDFVRDPHKLMQLTVTFYVKEMTEAEYNKIGQDAWIKTPTTSFVSNKYGKFIGVMARKNGVPESVKDATPKLKVLKETRYVDRSAEYTYVCVFENSDGDFVSAYKIEILASK